MTGFPQSLPYEIGFYNLDSELRVNKGFRNLLSEITGVLESFSYQPEISLADLEFIREARELLLSWVVSENSKGEIQ